MMYGYHWNSFYPLAATPPAFWWFGLPLFMIWGLAVVFLKGYALWHAARRNELGWFVALLIVHTMGILELVYLFKRDLLKRPTR